MHLQSRLEWTAFGDHLDALLAAVQEGNISAAQQARSDLIAHSEAYNAEYLRDAARRHAMRVNKAIIAA